MEKSKLTLLIASEVASILRTNPAYVYNLVKSGELDAVKLGIIKVNKETLVAFIEKNIGNDLTDPFNIKPIVNSKSHPTKKFSIKQEEIIIFKVAEIAQILRTNKAYVYDLIKSGLLSTIKIGRYKVPQDALSDFLEENIGNDLTDPYNIKSLIS